MFSSAIAPKGKSMGRIKNKYGMKIALVLI
jgi:hypothetical protein